MTSFHVLVVQCDVYRAVVHRCICDYNIRKLTAVLLVEILRVPTVETL